jgi:ribonuclease HII
MGFIAADRIAARRITRMTPQKFDRSLLPPSPDLSFELALWGQGVRVVAGIDEAGRGALAGPVAAGVVILPVDPGLTASLSGVRDSKQMSPAEREKWAGRIRQEAAGYAVGFASNLEIDDLGILPATRLAIERSLAGLEARPEHLLVDYLVLPEVPIPQTSLVKGDARSLSIAAASILAKTARDACMIELEGKHPGYGFSAHKGYGTLAHRRRLARLGPSPVHRLSFNFSAVQLD